MTYQSFRQRLRAEAVSEQAFEQPEGVARARSMATAEKRVARFLWVPPARMLLAIGLTLACSFVATAQDKPNPDTKKETAAPTAQSSFLRAWLGVSWPHMQEFNNLLQIEQNNPIGSSLTVAGELDAIPVPVPGLSGVTIKIPIGAEYIGASSRTSHSANGAAATVNWNLPAFGVYLSPRLTIHRQKLSINIRPLGVGYYAIGQALGTAELTVSDRPGSLTVQSRAWGYLGAVGMEYPITGVSVMIEGGYRRLEFNDVTLTPTGGFTTGTTGVPVRVSALPQALDYSGPVVRVGLGFHF